MDDKIPLIFQQLPATTGFVHNCGHFFKRLICQAQTEVKGEKKEKKEEGKGGYDAYRLKNELELAAYLSLWESFNSNKIKIKKKLKMNLRTLISLSL